jgi:GNAT superfamily N-acetyltransferase
MEIIKQEFLTPIQKEVVCKLWNREYPESLKLSGIAALDEYLNKHSNNRHYLLTNDQGGVIAWGVLFDRDDEKWFAMILDSRIQGQGLGSRLLSEMKKSTAKLYGWVINHDKELKSNGESYRSPLPFYTKNGFVTVPEERLELLNLSAVKIEWVQDS